MFFYLDDLLSFSLLLRSYTASSDLLSSFGVAAAATATTKGLTPGPHTYEARVLLRAFWFDFVFVQRNLGL